MRQVHFSRNPKIASFLHEYDYVQEFGEGVDRMYTEMEKAGLPAPEYCDNAFMLHAIIRNGTNAAFSDYNDGVNDGVNVHLTDTELLVFQTLQKNPYLTAAKTAEIIGKSKPTVERAIQTLRKKKYIVREGSAKKGKWIILK